MDSKIQWAAQQAIDSEVSPVEGGPRHGRGRGPAHRGDPRAGHRAQLRPERPGRGHRRRARRRGAVRRLRARLRRKVITMSAVIQQGVATPATQVVVPGTLQHRRRLRRARRHRPRHRAPDAQRGPRRVQQHRHRPGLAPARAERHGQAQRHTVRLLSAFGLGRPSGLGLPGESPGILAPAADWNHSQQYTVPFGQGLSVNALQATSVYSTIANDGVRVTPTLVKGYVGGRRKVRPGPGARRTQVVSAQTAQQVSQMLESVVSAAGHRHQGARSPATGWRARPAPPTASGQLRPLLRLHRLVHRLRARRRPALVIGVFVEGPQGALLRRLGVRARCSSRSCRSRCRSRASRRPAPPRAESRPSPGNGSRTRVR